MSLLKSRNREFLNESTVLNVQNGNDAEVLSASMLLMATGGEISWGSRNEDSRKIDIICSYDHPWIDKERIVFFVQVKSGDSYGRLLKSDGFLLKKRAKIEAQRTSHSICLLWVHRKSNNVYWAYIHPNTTRQNQEYGNNHQVLPTIRYDIARCQASLLSVEQGAKGIIITVKNHNLAILRKSALDSYRNFSEVVNPNLGLINFTRMGWRHMFRKSRKLKYKKTSLNLIFYLDKILKNRPSKIYISNLKFLGELFPFRQCEYVLEYNGAQIYNKEKRRKESIKIIIRLMEEIMWPKDWNERSTLTQFVDRKVIILSCTYKYI